MNLVPETTAPQFKGMLVVHAKDRQGGVSTTAINTKEITTIHNEKYIDREEDDDDDVKIVDGAYMTLNNGCSVKVFAPVDKVIDAYIHAADEGVYEIDARYPTLLQKPLFG